MSESVEPSRTAPGRLPPIWLMGFGFLPLGAQGTLTLITVPQLLAANGVPQDHITAVTGFALIPGFCGFALAPLLDWRFSRRFYAIAFTLMAAVCQFGAMISVRDLTALSWMLFASGIAISLSVAAVGGWFGNLTPTEAKGRLGVWFTVANLGGGGVVAGSAIWVLRDLPYPVGAGLLCLTIALAIPLYLWVPCPPADGRLASESFAAFARDVLALLRKPAVLVTLALFLAPTASFALTNQLSGVGADFHASEGFVGLIGGLGIAAAGVLGSLLISPLSVRLPPRVLYLAVGLTGAAFSLSLMVMARTPAIFGVAMLGENLFQAASFSVQNIIVLRTIGHDNPLAATQFGLLNGATMVPLTYMQFIDGQAYDFSGINSSFLADAALSGVACLIAALALWLGRRWLTSIGADQPAPAPATEAIEASA